MFTVPFVYIFLKRKITNKNNIANIYSDFSNEILMYFFIILLLLFWFMYIPITDIK